MTGAVAGVLNLQQTRGNGYVQRWLHAHAEAARVVLARSALRPAQPSGANIKILRDLAREHPGRLSEPAALSADEIQDAINFNRARYGTASIRIIQDIIGAPVTGVVDETTIDFIVGWQADARLTTDGKVGLLTLRTIVREMIAEGIRNRVISLIIDGHNISTAGLTSIRFDSTLTAANAQTSGPIPGNSTVRVGPSAFAQGYEGLVHTIAHELEHVRQRRAGIANQDEREFLAEAIEITSVGMLQEGLAGFMDDAARALQRFNNLPAAAQTRLAARYRQVREQVRRRFNAASAADRATHQAVMDGYNALNP